MTEVTWKVKMVERTPLGTQTVECRPTDLQTACGIKVEMHKRIVGRGYKWDGNWKCYLHPTDPNQCVHLNLIRVP